MNDEDMKKYMKYDVNVDNLLKHTLTFDSAYSSRPCAHEHSALPIIRGDGPGAHRSGELVAGKRGRPLQRTQTRKKRHITFSRSSFTYSHARNKTENDSEDKQSVNR